MASTLRSREKRAASEHCLTDAAPERTAMKRFSSLSTGTKLLIVGTVALFLNLSLTWQKIDVDFGQAGQAELLLDGWDAWGLLIGLLSLGLLVLTVLIHLTDVELPEDVPWGLVTLVVAGVLVLVTAVKNLTDDGSTIASYVGIALAGLVLAGAYLNVRQTRAERASSTVRV
jgi:hypothetical protein